MEKYKKNRLIIIGSSVTAIIVILAVSLGFLIHDMIYSAKISIMVAPIVATVRIGDMEFGSSGEYKMVPGEYAVEIKAEGFATQTGSITLKSGETSDLNMYLISNSETTTNWYDEHTEDALIVGEIQNAETLKAINELIKKEPVLTELPLEVEYYSDDMSEYTKYKISYILDDSDRGFYLIMKDYTGAGTDAAINRLTEMGMDMAGIKLIYENLEDEMSNGYAE